MKTGIEIIAEERLRQVEQEGWTFEQELAKAAQALDEAAERAKCEPIFDYSLERRELVGYRVNKESILKIKGELK